MVSLLKLNIRKKGTLMIMGLLGNLIFGSSDIDGTSQVPRHSLKLRSNRLEGFRI